MSSTANFIVSGVLADGTPIVFGALASDGTSHPAIHHVSSASQFQAESWDGEHAEHEHHEQEEAARRFSIYLEEGEKKGEEQDDDEPIASSAQFERTRSASLAAALLELDPRGVPLVQFFKLATAEPLLELDEGEDEVEPSGAELVLGQLLFTLRALKMSGADAKHSEAVQRLRELEEELRAAGAVTPADPAVSEAVARALAVAGAGRDVQIRVNQSKHTTTTKTVYETETSAMAHMETDQIRNLHQQILSDITSGAEQHAGQDSGTTQKKETAEEGFTNEDGSVVVSKKMTRVVTTTRTTLPGEGEEAPDSPSETSLGSVKDRIARFEQLKDFHPDPSASGAPAPVSSQEEHHEEHHEEPEVHFQYEHKPEEHYVPEPDHSKVLEQVQVQVQVEDEDDKEVHVEEEIVRVVPDLDLHEHNDLEPTVGIVITPHTPIPPEHPGEFLRDDEEEREPLELSEPEHVAHAELKDTREYSDEELTHELQPSEEHVSTAEIKDIKSYSPTSSEERVSPPIPQVRHAISPSVASESHEDDELAAHFVAESFEKQPDHGEVETIEQTPVYRGHHSPGQTSPIVSEHPIAQEYAESVTSHDEGDNLSLKSGHEPEIARHSVEAVTEEPEEEGDFAKKAGLIAGAVALTAVGANDALKKSDDDEKPEEHEELTTQTTIMESPIRHEDLPHPEHAEPHHESSETLTTVTRDFHEDESEPHLTETITTTTVTREYHEEPVSELPREFRESAPTPETPKEVSVSPSFSAPSPALEHEYVVSETTVTETVTRDFPAHSDDEEITTTTTTVTRQFPEGAEEEEHLVKETTTTTTVTRAESPAVSEKFEEPHYTETTTTTTVTREFHEQASPVESVKSIPRIIETEHQDEERPESPASSEKDHFVTETTTTTTTTREYFDEPEHVQEPSSPAPSSHVESERPLESPAVSEKELPHVVETTTTTTVTREYHEDDYERPESPVAASPAPSSHVESERPVAESPAISEKHDDPHYVTETTTTTTTTREYFEDEPIHREESPAAVQEHDVPASPSGSEVPSEHSISRVVETTTTTVTHELHQEQSDEPEPEVYRHDSPTQFQQPEHRAPGSPDDDESDGEGFGSKVLGFAKKAGMVAGAVVAAPVALAAVGAKSAYDALKKTDDEEEGVIPEATTTSQWSSEYLDDEDDEKEPKVQEVHEERPESPASAKAVESPVPSEKDHFITETTTTTTTTREYYDEPEHVREPSSPSPSSHVESERPLESPAVSEKELPHVVETTTTTTVTREYHEDDHERPESPVAASPAPSSHVESERPVAESPAISEKHDEPHYVTETTTTTTTTREYFEDEPEQPVDSERLSEPARSPVGTPHDVETTTTTITREYVEDPEHQGEEHLVKETTTTTTVTHEVQEEPAAPVAPPVMYREHDDFGYEPSESPVSVADVLISGSPAIPDDDYERQESPASERASSVHSEKNQFVTETTTTTTTTREYFDEPEHVQEPSSPAPSSHVESERPLESPAVFEKELPHVVETTTSTTVTREYHEDDYERPESPVAASPAPSSHVESERPVAESPAISEKHDEPHYVTETTTTTTTTREYFEDEPLHREESPAAVQEHDVPASPSGSEVPSEHSISRVVESTTTTVTRELYQEQPDEPEYPAGQYQEQYHHEEPTEQAPLMSERHEQADDDSESDGEGFGSKVLGFAKKAGMVAGAVVAAPVALAAVGAKSAYDALKKSDDEEEPEEHEKLLSKSDSPIASSHYEHEPSEPHHFTETTTTTTVTREYFDEPEEKIASPAPSSHVESERPQSLPVSEPEQEQHHVESTTTTTVTRDYHEEDPRVEEPEEHKEPVETTTTVTRDVYEPAEGEEPAHHFVETTTTTTVTKEFSDDEDVEEAPEEIPHVVETVTTTQVTREYDEDEEKPFDSESHVTETTTTTTVTREFYGDQDVPESPIPSEDQGVLEQGDLSSPTSESVTSISREHHEDEPHVVETITTTTVTREFHTDTEEASDDVELVKETTTTVTREIHEEPEVESPPSEKEDFEGERVQESYERQESTASAKDLGSPVRSEKDHFVTETTTTTTTTREYFDEPEHVASSPAPSSHVESERPLESPSVSEKELPHVVETTTTTTVTREYHEDDYERPESPIAASPAPSSHVESERPVAESPAISEKHEEPHYVTETTTTTTTTREYFEDEPLHREESPAAVQEHDVPASPSGSEVPSEHSISRVVETTTTTVTRELHQEQLDEPEYPAGQHHEHYEEPEHYVPSEPQQYHHEEPEPTERAPLMSERHEQANDDSESDGEGFGSKVLGFAKKAGMVAGAVVAAPVALAAVGAKSAYDALKKSDDEEEPEEHEKLLSKADSPVAHYEQEPAHESPSHHFTETTTVTQEYREGSESPIRETTTTTETREFHEGSPVPSHKSEDLKQFQDESSPSSSDQEKHPEEPKPELERQGSYSPGYSPKSPRASPVGSDEESRRVVETTTTTTVTHEDVPKKEEDEDDLVSPATSEEDVREVVKTTTTTVTSEHFEPEHRQESPTPSEESVRRVVETTTTVTEEHFVPAEQPEDLESPAKSPYEQPTEYGRVDSHDAPASPAPSVESGEDQEEHRVVETTTTTTVTREYHDDEYERPELPASAKAAGSPVPSEKDHYVTETTTTTSTTREYFDEPEHVQEPSSPAPSSHVESERPLESPAVSEKELPHVVETTTTTTVTREYHEDDYERPESPIAASPALSSNVESERPVSESPAISEKHEEPHYVTETTTTTTTTREYFEDEPHHREESPAAVQEHDVPASPSGSEVPSEHSISRVVETTTTTVTRELHQEQPDEPEYPAGQDQEYYHEETHHYVPSEHQEQYHHEEPEPTERAPLMSERHEQADDDSESDGEGFGSKVLGFAKKAGMVAGAVVAAPVALAAVGAKSAYDALKQSDDEEEPEEHEKLLSKSDSPVASEKDVAPYEQERTSPIPSESFDPTHRSSVASEGHHFTETTTTTTVTREYFDDELEPVPEPRDLEAEPQLEQDIPHIVETTTTTTVTREYHEDDEKVPEDLDDHEKVETTTTDSREVYETAQGSEPEHHFIETTTTTTVTKEVFQPDEQEEEEPVSHQEEQEGFRPPSGSEADDEGHAPRYLETTTTTTVTREYEVSEDEDEHVVESQEYRSGSPAPSEELEVVKTTTTITTVTREHYEPEDDGQFGDDERQDREHQEVIESHEYTESPTPSEDSMRRVVETTTTTTVTSEHFEPEDHHDDSVIPSEEHQTEEPARRVVETTTTTTVTSEHYEPEHGYSPVPFEEHVETTEERFEPKEDVIESQEYVSGSPAHFEKERSVSPAPSQESEPITTELAEPEHIIESEQYSGRSPSPSQEHLEHSVTKTTSTTVTREYQEHHEDPEQAPLMSEQRHDQADDDSESDGEGFGSKVLGFAKKAGMVAGAVVAAPVALAAVGAKSAYDALKKSDDEEEPEEQQLSKPDSPVASSHYAQEEEPSKVDDSTQEPGAQFYEPEEEDHVIESEEYSRSSSAKDEPKIISPAHSVQEGESESAYIIESEQYEQAVREEISSPVHSDAEDVVHVAHEDEEDAPYVIDSEEYEFVGREEPRIASPAHEEDVIESESYPRHHQPESEDHGEDPSIVESEEYRRSPSDSGSERRPFEESTTTTVISVHHEPPAIPEPELDEEDAYEQEEAVIDSHDYQGHTTVTSVEAVSSEQLEHPESPTPSEDSVRRVVETTTTTTVTSEHFEPEDHHDDSVIPSEEYQTEESARRVVETTTTTTVTSEHYEPEHGYSPVPSEEHVETIERFEPTDDVIESQEYGSASPAPSQDSERHVETTTTTTTVTREHVEEEDLPASPAEEATHVIETTTTTTKTIESAEGSPEPEVVETIITTTVTQERYDPENEKEEEGSHGFIKTTTTTTTTTSSFEPEEPMSPPTEQAPVLGESVIESELPEHSVIKTTSTTVTRKYQEDEPDLEHHEDPEHAPLMSERQEESGEDSDGEGFGSKVLGFAKKAGMVAGAVVAAPVALAAVGAKSAYDALKKSDDEEEPEEQEHLLSKTDSPVSSEKDVAHYEQERTSPVPSESFDQTHRSSVASEGHFTETTTTTTVTHEHFTEPEEKNVQELQGPSIHNESHQDSESEGSFVDHGESSEGLPLQSTEAAFKLSREDIAEQTAEKLVSEVFHPLDRTLIESEQYRASIESLNRPSASPSSPIEKKKSVDDLATEAFQNVTKISYGHADEGDDYKDTPEEEEWKVYDRHGEVLEEFSTQLTDDVIQEAEGDATSQLLMRHEQEQETSQVQDASPRRSTFLKQESCQEISNEPEVDYYSDLQEKLNILAGEKSNLGALVEEELPSTASDQLDVIHESDHEHEEHHEEEEPELEHIEQEEPTEEQLENTAIHLVDQVLEQVVQELSDEEHDDQKTMTSDAYLTATSEGDGKDDQYDTCVTSQDDTYESAQGWTSQDSEYTTATSHPPSRLSDSEGELTARDERQETSTPQAMLSPVDSDRQFTVQQDFELPVLPAIRAFDPDDFMQSTARSTPDVALQVTIEEEDESDDKLPISPSGVLLPPAADPGRPVSPVPPRRAPEGSAFDFPEENIVEPTPPPIEVHDEPESGRIQGVAMDDQTNSESSRYSRQLSDLSSSAETESHADTVIRVGGEDRSGSSDSLEVVSVISKTSTPEKEERSQERTEGVGAHLEEQKLEEKDQEDPSAEQLGFEVYDAEQPIPIEELETVEEEPEDSDSLNEGNGSGHSSVGVPADTLAMIGKYRHQSSDNLSLTSLQEFERLEKEVGARGDGSLTRSEIELLVAGRLNKSGEGSVSSLAEFERLEKEMTENQSPPEDVMMLSDIREESEAEDMSIRDDDEEDGSDTELRSRPVQEEDLRGVTPVAPSPTDSLEHQMDPVQLQYLETSTDSLEPTFQEIEVEQRADSAEDTSLAEYEMVPRVMEASTTDSLDGGVAGTEKDSLLEGASQGIESTQSTHGMLSGDTMGTVVTTDDDDKDSLDGEVSSMLQSYPTTLTTFQTTVVAPDGSVQTISRRVETRVTDPLISHVTFTGTESQERLDQLPDDEQFETVDTEGNVTRTTFRRDHEQQHQY